MKHVVACVNLSFNTVCSKVHISNLYASNTGILEFMLLQNGTRSIHALHV